MEQVRLEMTASVELHGGDVALFVQELKGIQAEALCEVQTIWSKRPTTAKGAVVTTAQLECERVVADFLCQRFSKLCRHVSSGEVMMVRCKRVHLGVLPLSAANKALTAKSTGRSEQKNQEVALREGVHPMEEARSASLPRSVVVDLLDCLGDRVAEVHDAFTTHAESFENSVRLTMLGLHHALTDICKDEWRAGALAKHNEAKDDAPDRLSMQRLRHLLTRLHTQQRVAFARIPESTHAPFVSYTDFLAIYLAYLQELQTKTTDTSCNARK
ncbi:hypothetical protein Poli38472_008255 [Pythium oligandrum]|uniref:Uncharacterized protein n=1 Tax=Pythium oligandrum TaxID=41045 RepID=A0A8K1CMG7_PYTOL|nr:hypothetical protein Poli38472_008255 [Pythium oligandrum]|eukprot:TMW65613.1 hypothetical protein Poli38472_008255 [Pythium oligandrum]